MMAYGRVGVLRIMKRAVAVLLLTGFALALAGCSGPCGFIWEDWRRGKVCRSEPAPQK
jgi:hypothetical protein